jgi:hypothetical protein
MPRGELTRRAEEIAARQYDIPGGRSCAKACMRRPFARGAAVKCSAG